MTTLALVCPAKGEVLPPLRAQHHHHTASSTHSSSSSGSLHHPGGVDGHNEEPGAGARVGGAAGVGVVGCTMGFRMLEESVSFGSKAGSSGGKGQLYLAYRKGHTPLGMCEVTFKGGAYTVALWLFCWCMRASGVYNHDRTHIQ